MELIEKNDDDITIRMPIWQFVDLKRVTDAVARLIDAENNQVELSPSEIEVLETTMTEKKDIMALSNELHRLASEFRS